MLLFLRPETQHRGATTHSESDIPEQEEEILGSDDDEQEDPNDYCKGAFAYHPQRGAAAPAAPSSDQDAGMCLLLVGLY